MLWRERKQLHLIDHRLPINRKLEDKVLCANYFFTAKKKSKKKKNQTQPNDFQPQKKSTQLRQELSWRLYHCFLHSKCPLLRNIERIQRSAQFSHRLGFLFFFSLNKKHPRKKVNNKQPTINTIYSTQMVACWRGEKLYIRGIETILSCALCALSENRGKKWDRRPTFSPSTPPKDLKKKNEKKKTCWFSRNRCAFNSSNWQPSFVFIYLSRKKKNQNTHFPLPSHQSIFCLWLGRKGKTILKKKRESKKKNKNKPAPSGPSSSAMSEKKNDQKKFFFLLSLSLSPLLLLA